jgi:hypothetical protein
MEETMPQAQMKWSSNNHVIYINHLEILQSEDGKLSVSRNFGLDRRTEDKGIMLN